MITLREAAANIHNDPSWWRQVLLGGALQLTVVGYPWAAGLEVESLDNIRKGYPTPLPPAFDHSSRYVIGIFALLIDFVFFLLPVLISGLILFCSAVVFVLASGNTITWLWVIGVVLAIYELCIFATGAAPIARIMYAEQGFAEDALSSKPLREALRPGARSIYTQARLRSLPAYLPALLLVLAIVLVINLNPPALLFIVIALLWLASSALLYAHLIVVQLYGAAHREARYL